MFANLNYFYSNAGSAALIVLLILVGCGVYVLLRLRRNARLQRVALGLQQTDELGQHEMERFINRGQGDEDERYSDETYRQSSTNLANGTAAHRQEIAQRDIPQNEEIFDVGSESDEEK